MAGSPHGQALSRDIDARAGLALGPPDDHRFVDPRHRRGGAPSTCAPRRGSADAMGYARRMDRAAARSLDILVEVPQVESQITASVHPQMIALSALAQGALVAMRAAA